MTQQINLLDVALLPARDWCDSRTVLTVATALLLGNAVHFAYERHAMDRVIAAASAAPAEALADAANPLDDAIAEAQTRVGSQRRLLHALASVDALPRDSAARLRALIAALPREVWLEEVEFGVDGEVRITGGALDAGALASFSNRLGATSAFAGLPLQVFALRPQAAVAAGDAQATTVSPSYGFVFSSTDAAQRAARGQ